MGKIKTNETFVKAQGAHVDYQSEGIWQPIPLKQKPRVMKFILFNIPGKQSFIVVLLFGTYW